MLTPTKEEKSQTSTNQTEIIAETNLFYDGDEIFDASCLQKQRLHQPNVDGVIGNSSNELSTQDLVPSSRHSSTHISWASVVAKFTQKYEKVFVDSKKAHFDSLPENSVSEDKVIDGARLKWCIPLLLDAVIFFLEHNAFDLSRRRSFNQHRVLYECIWESIVETWKNAKACESKHTNFCYELITRPMLSKENNDNDSTSEPNNLSSLATAKSLSIQLSMIHEILSLRQSFGNMVVRATDSNTFHKFKKFSTQVSSCSFHHNRIDENGDLVEIHSGRNVEEEEIKATARSKASLETKNRLKSSHFLLQHTTRQESDEISRSLDRLSQIIILDDAVQLPPPWHNLHFLQESLLKNETASKSTGKLSRVLSSLCRHEVWQGRQSDSMFLATAYRQVILHAILYYHNYAPVTVRWTAATSFEESNPNSKKCSCSSSASNDRSCREESINNVNEGKYMPAVHINDNQINKDDEYASSSTQLPWFVPFLNTANRNNFMQSIWPCLVTSTSSSSTLASTTSPSNADTSHHHMSPTKAVANNHFPLQRGRTTGKNNRVNRQQLYNMNPPYSGNTINSDISFNATCTSVENMHNNDSSNGNKHRHPNDNHSTSSSMQEIYTEHHLLLATEFEEDAPDISSNMVIASYDVFHSIAAADRDDPAAACLFSFPDKIQQPTVPTSLRHPISISNNPVAVTSSCPSNKIRPDDDNSEPQQKKQKIYASCDQHHTSSFLCSPNSAFALTRDSVNGAIHHMHPTTAGLENIHMYQYVGNNCADSNSSRATTDAVSGNYDEVLINNLHGNNNNHCVSSNYPWSQNTAISCISNLQCEYYSMPLPDREGFLATQEIHHLPSSGEADESEKEEELPAVSP